MKFGQVIEYIKRIIFLQLNAENQAERLVPDLYISGESKWFTASFQHISIVLNLVCNKNKFYIKYKIKMVIKINLRQKKRKIKYYNNNSNENNRNNSKDNKAKTVR